MDLKTVISIPVFGALDAYIYTCIIHQDFLMKQ